MPAVTLAFPPGIYHRAPPPEVQGPQNSFLSSSGDVWATVITNVAPLVALVGDRNAKEFLRMSSTTGHLLLMSTAPLGILSVAVSAIRLSGHRTLRRLIGRGSDRRGEALVELTPLSVAPASSVFTSHAVEIESSEQIERVAFVCAHVKRTSRVLEALQAFKHLLKEMQAFKHLLKEMDGKAELDNDYELVLGLTNSSLSKDETVSLTNSLINDKEIHVEESFASKIAFASISFRRTGISPTQTAERPLSFTDRQGFLDVLVGVMFFLAIGSLQVGAFYAGEPRHHIPNTQTLLMGLVGYFGTVVFTFTILLLIKGEVRVKQLKLPPIFDNAIWTFSDSRHAKHQMCDAPVQNTLVSAAPASFSEMQKRIRQVKALLECGGLSVSYIILYLGLRVNQWWVSLGYLAIIWLAAGFRATSIRNTLTANGIELGEHWLGIFRETAYDSLLATVALIASKGTDSADVPFCQADRMLDTNSDTSMPTAYALRELRSSKHCALLVAKPKRESLRTWSGCEDVMKVSLDMAKNICQSQSFADLGDQLNIPNDCLFKRIVRFQLMIYVPGLLWKANSHLDYIMTEAFNIETLYRDIIKILHLCAYVDGSITRHAVQVTESIELSNLLCGPVDVPPVSLEGTKTLSELLSALSKMSPQRPKAFTLEQAMLLPTIQLAAIYESVGDGSTASIIQRYKGAHPDSMALSGAAWLPTLERVFHEQNIWGHFMSSKPPVAKQDLKPRDDASGGYGRPLGAGIWYGQYQGY